MTTRPPRDKSATTPRPPRDLWEQLDTLRSDVIGNRRPPESFSKREYAQRYQLSDATAIVQIRRLVDAGKLKRVAQEHQVIYYAPVTEA